MPFLGVLPERQHIFQPVPKADVPVNDRLAWTHYPTFRHVYDKLLIAKEQGLLAAPCTENPIEHGVSPDQILFIKPITNLEGMSINARALSAKNVPAETGSFWSEYLEGSQSSTDALLLDGEPKWFAHTLASEEKNCSRSVYWEIGVNKPENERITRHFAQQNLSGYTGIINVELIGEYIIEVHLRGSNTFFDFYSKEFFENWVRLVDEHSFISPVPIKHGYVYSFYSEIDLPIKVIEEWPYKDISLQIDNHVHDRACILRGDSLEAIEKAVKLISVHAG